MKNLFLIPMLLAVAEVHAQNYAVGWFKISGGGGTSTGGVFVASGTLGQPNAGGPLTGGGFAVVGGFWALPVVVPTPGAPVLSIVPAGPGLSMVSWSPAMPGFVLQEKANLSQTNWQNAPSGATNPVVVPAALPRKFYRLFQP